MEINEVRCKSILSESKLYSIDYSINPYTGCQHGCKYCYAVFMKRYTDHSEPWGQFVDVKVNAVEKLKEEVIKAEMGSVLLSTVTDPYQPVEKKYELTRKILKTLSKTEFPVSILTKSDLVLRDLDILKEFSPEKISVGFTVNFADDKHRKKWEPATSTIEDKVNALNKLYSENITTYVHTGPWFEGIADLDKILEVMDDYIYEFQIENLNLARKEEVLKTIGENYPELEEKYREICNNISSHNERLKERVKKLEDKYDTAISLFID